MDKACVAALHGHWARYIARINRAPMPYPAVHFPSLTDGVSDRFTRIHGTRERGTEREGPTHPRVASVSRSVVTEHPFANLGACGRGQLDLGEVALDAREASARGDRPDVDQ